MNNQDIHPIQSEILCELLFLPEASFSKLNKRKVGSDQFSFHLRQLTDLNYIEKTVNGTYVLTIKGKEFANRFDTEAKEIERQPKIGACVVATKIINGSIYYMTQQRLKQPYYGFWGFITGKIKWGEKATETAARELLEESGLTAEIGFVGLRHKTDYSKDGKLLEDKYFLTFKAENCKGELVVDFDGGKNCWMTKEEIFRQEDVFDDIEEIIEMIENNKFSFAEKEYVVKRY